jgi:hypothetical protein
MKIELVVLGVGLACLTSAVYKSTVSKRKAAEAETKAAAMAESLDKRERKSKEVLDQIIEAKAVLDKLMMQHQKEKERASNHLLGKVVKYSDVIEKRLARAEKITADAIASAIEKAKEIP